MKKHSLALATVMLTGIASYAQTGNVGIGIATPDPSARLDVTGTNRGVLLTRVSLLSSTDAVTVPTPATGLIVYNINAAMPAKQGFYYNAGTTVAPQWVRLAGVDGGIAPGTGQSILWNGTTYVPGNPAISTNNPVFSGNGTPGSPLNINTASPVYNASQIQGNTVSNVAPTVGQTYVFNGSTFVAGNPAISTNNPVFSGNGTPGSPLNINTASPVYNASQIQGNTVSNVAPVAGQTYVYNGSTFVAGNPAISTNNPVFSGNGTPGSPLNINTASPVYNASQIQGNTVSNVAPVAGQTYVFNGTSFVAGNPAISTNNPVFSGNGTPASPLNINTASPVYNANTIQGNAVSNVAPVAGQTYVFNGTTFVAGNPAISTNNTVFSGNGTPSNPLNINVAAPVYNAGLIQGKTVTNTAPTTGQSIVYNGTTYAPGNPAITTNNVVFSGNGTPATPLNINTGLAVYNASTIQGNAVSNVAPTTGQSYVFNGTTFVAGNPAISTNNPVFTGNGTPSNPLNINTASPVYNASTIQGKTVSTTAPTTNQVLVYNGTQYAPANVVVGATNGIVLNGTTVGLGGALTQSTTINTGAGKTLSVTGATTTTTFDANGNVGIGTASPSNALTINATNPLRLQGLQIGTGNTLVVDANGVVKQIPATISFHYSTCNTGSVSITQAAETGAVPYAAGSSPNGSIPGGGSWSAIPGLSKTINLSDNTNDVSFSCEGVTQYDGTMNTSSFCSYSIGIFVDGTLQATRSFTMVGSGSVAQFDTWQVSGQAINMSAGNHTFAVYVARRNSNNSANDKMYYCGPVPTIANTNSFMNKGVLFINGSY